MARKPTYRELEQRVQELEQQESDKEMVAQSLRNSEAHLLTLIETIPDLVWLKDQNGVYITCNRKFERFFGAKKSQIVGKTDYDFVDKELADFFREKDRTAIANGQPVVNEEEVTFSDDGHQELLETIKTPMFDSQNNLVGVLGVARDITQRKNIEKALQLSETRLQLALEVGNIGIWDWNITSDTWYASTTYYTMLGYEPVSGLSDRKVWLKRVHPEDREYVSKKIQAILDFQTNEYQYEARMKHADGSYRWHLVIGHVIERDHKEKPVHLIGLRIDIHERKKAEISLAARQREFEMLYRISEIELRGFSLPAMLMKIVEKVATTFGFPAVSIALYHEAEQEMEFVASTGFPLPLDQMSRKIPVEQTASGIVARTGHPLVETRLMERPEASFDFFRDLGFQTFVGVPMFVGQRVLGTLSLAGKAPLPLHEHMVPMAQNTANLIASIIERKRAVEERLLNHQRTQALLQLGQMAEAALGEITEFALEKAVELTQSKIGYLAFLNEDETVLTMHAWSKSAMAQCDIQDKPIEYPVVNTGLWGEAVRQRKSIITNDYSAANPWKKGVPDGHVRLVRHMNAPVFSGSKIVVVAGVGNKATDYTETDVQHLSLIVQGMWRLVERKRAQEEHAKLQAQLTQAQKMEAIGRLAGGIAHDFNNMLGVIIGRTDLLLNETDPAQPIFADLKEIRKAADRSADLTRQLLAFARKQAIAPRVLNLNRMVEGMTQMLQRIMGEDIHLRLTPGKDLWPVIMDPGQIDQILVNLCVNARDAIDGIGKVSIETGNRTIDQSYCKEHGDFKPGAFVMLAVSDSGCGMDRKILGNIFEPFFSTKLSGKGTGLGLSTVYGIVKQNRGFINVYSEPGHGSTFRIYLPRHWPANETLAKKDIEKPLISKGSETILVVEDNEDILKITMSMLETQGYGVLTASSPTRALELADQYAGTIDLLITDVIMPEMNGKDLADKIQSRHPDMKLLFMSGYTANVIAHHGVLDQGINFIQKPFSIQELAVKTKDALK